MTERYKQELQSTDTETPSLEELIVLASTALDTFVSQSICNSRLTTTVEAASASLQTFEAATERIGEAKRRELLDAVDHREAKARGDLWHVLKSWHPDLWDSFDREAILRVANTAQLYSASKVDVADVHEWVLKRAKEGIFGRGDINTDLTLRLRRQAVQLWCVFSEAEKNEAIDKGMVDDEFLEVMERLKMWEMTPLEKWKHKTFPEVVAARVSLRVGETDNPKSFALNHWQHLADVRKQQLADFGIVDREFLDAMNQLERWANGNRQSLVTAAANLSVGVQP